MDSLLPYPSTPALSPYPISTQLMQTSSPLSSYSQLIAEWPMAVLLLCLAFIFLCTLAGLLGSPPLDFSEPLLVRDAWTEHLSSVWGRQLIYGGEEVELVGSGSSESCRSTQRPNGYNPGKGEPKGQIWEGSRGRTLLLGPHPHLHTSSSLLPSLQGFEPRDTEISRKLEVWKAMQALTGPKNLLSLSPDPEVNR